MREIKFRAWDKEKKYMIVIFDNTKQKKWFLPSLSQKYELMQYTGLKDTNGKDIYEGDILQGIGNVRKVVFNEENCSFMLKEIKLRKELFLLTKEKSKNLEVIGNIYENEELIGD